MRIAIVNHDRCQPKKFCQECKKSCPEAGSGFFSRTHSRINIRETMPDVITCAYMFAGELCIELTPHTDCGDVGRQRWVDSEAPISPWKHTSMLHRAAAWMIPTADVCRNRENHTQDVGWIVWVLRFWFLVALCSCFCPPGGVAAWFFAGEDSHLQLISKKE